jgi:hypothetical protein
MTRVRLAGDDGCHHGVPWDDWCAWCEAEDEAVCTDCGWPWLSCICPPADAQLALDLGPQRDRQQAMDEVIAVARRGRGLEIVTDPMGRVA